MPPVRVIVTFVSALMLSIGSIVDQIWPYMPREFPALLLAAAVVMWLVCMQLANRHFMIRQIRENQAANTDRIVKALVDEFDEIDLVGRMIDRMHEKNDEDA